MQHFGLKEDNERLMQNQKAVYGRPSWESDHVDTVIKSQNLNGLADKFNDIKQSKYASAIKEPLGRSINRDYNWPQQVQTPQNFNFGKGSIICDKAKDLIAPANGALDEIPEVAMMYAQSHNNVEAGT